MNIGETPIRIEAFVQLPNIGAEIMGFIQNQNFMNAEGIKDEIRKPDRIDETDWYAYQGPLGRVIRYEQVFFAWKHGIRMGIYSTLEGAMKSLEERG